MPRLKIRLSAHMLAVSCVLLPLHAGAQPPEFQDPPSAAPVAELSEAALKQLAEQAALANKLPVDYFMRLIGRESGFNKNAISTAGAQGVAQFMPATARDRGLKDPFDPIEALPKSAELLNDLNGQFGNLGLAAAAYNAGPRRVQDWLSGRGRLPAETWHYVFAITGRSAEDWAPPGAHVLGPAPANSLAGIGGTEGLNSRKNWELALLLSMSGTALEKPLVLTTAAKPSTLSGLKTRGRHSSQLNGELSLCTTCIVQKFY